MISSMFTQLPDLAAERLGGKVLAANDEFFAPKEALIKPGKPEWREGEYTPQGKWMDGWETRRRRSPGHDWAVLRLGIPGTVRGVVIDTSYFTGNYPELASLEGTTCDGAEPTESWDALAWDTLLPPSQLMGNTRNEFSVVASPHRVTHLRLNIFPDGGVARLRVHGEPVAVDSVFAQQRELDLAALEHGGLVIACSDMHYGNPQNLLQPGRSTHMGDGWETKRRRGPGHDWTVIRLARRGVITRVELDTDYYKGNAPGRAMLERADGSGAFDPATAGWTVLVPETPLDPDARRSWEVSSPEPATHVRLNISPDGGVARLRVFGKVAG